MSKTKAQGNHGNSQQHADASRKGGETSSSNATKGHSAKSGADLRHQDNLSEEQRRAIGRKGGEAVSKNREHMAEIGRKGGQHSHVASK